MSTPPAPNLYSYLGRGYLFFLGLLDIHDPTACNQKTPFWLGAYGTQEEFVFSVTDR